MQKSRSFHDIMQKDTFKNIKPWFFRFSSILGLYPLNKSLFWSKGYCVRITHIKNGQNQPHSIFMSSAKGALIFNKNELHTIKSYWLAISIVVRPQREDFALFHLFWVTCGFFQVVLGIPGSHQPAPTCYNLYHMAKFVTKDDL